ncbi:MAG: nucleoside monophosphate kinase [Clostridia bacterium]|nr:nucleoside monophosphate kinase [Clostridia bacterium]
MVYIITGGPATGKGTRSDILSKALNIPHISTGDILREVALTDEDIKERLAKGELISDDIITKLLEERLSKDDCKNGFVLDGYPRTISQIYLLNEVLKKLGKKVDRVIELVVPDELAFKRILERKKCIQCGRAYGIDFPPVVEDICDDCGGKLEIRTDDTKETLKKRIDTYKKNSKEILEYYRNKGLLKTVDASSHSERIVEEATIDDYNL